MNPNLSEIETYIYNKCKLKISNLKIEIESKEYDACTFNLNGLNIIGRSAKITPKKIGQFVTFWKRKANGPIEPYEEKDPFDYFVINVRAENKLGQFVFPKSVLVKHGIISTDTKEGKRAFRVYPVWDKVNNSQAVKTQKWQLAYFYEIDNSIDIVEISNLYK